MLDPAHTIITKLGGVRIVANLAKRDQTRVRRWCWEKERGGTGGLIPTDVQHLLLAGARAMGVALTAEDFFDMEKVDQLARDLTPDVARDAA